jgi:PGDYG protein
MGAMFNGTQMTKLIGISEQPAPGLVQYDAAARAGLAMDVGAVDLRQDARASWYIKEETVQVEFARVAGSLASREGPNHYRAADALILGSGGDRWSVARERFDARYQAVPPLRHGADGAYRSRPLPVLARQIPQPFTVRRSLAGDRLQGSAGDWLLQYAPGDWGIVEDAKFRRLYRPCEAAPAATSPPARS